MANRMMQLRGVAVNNLRQVDLDLPHRRLIAFCGVSGSGKTSLALDTLYAEGQRRYIESFSPYTRQFLEQLPKPQAERISGLPPAVAVTHKNPSRSNRATVGTATQLNDYLGLLLAQIAELICYGCGQIVARDSAESITQILARHDSGTRFMLGFAAHPPDDQPMEDWLRSLSEAGYVRVFDGQAVHSLESPPTVDLSSGDAFTVIVDRLTAGRVTDVRLQDSVETALAAGGGHCVALVDRGGTWQAQPFSAARRCDACEIDFPNPEPSLFNFNSPLGACPECEGFGNIHRTDMGRVVPDGSKTLREGAIAPWNTPAYAHELEELLALADDYQIPVDVPFEALREKHLRLIHDGVPERDFGGLDGFFRWLERRKYKMHLRVFLSRWRSYYPCDVCSGQRLRPEALAYHLGGKNLAGILALTVDQAHDFFCGLALSPHQQAVAGRLVEDVTVRLAYLQAVGVGYLALDRPLRTLSSGEAQRVALTVSVGSNLVDMLYVLDEPSIGLHPANVESLVGALFRLRDRGNSVVVVEHEEDILRAADELVEIGPTAGSGGGQIVFHGTPSEAQQHDASLTGAWLAGRRGLGLTAQRRATNRGRLKLLGARGHNLQDINVDIPLGVVCLVTGVSGAGKSTLVNETLYPELYRQLHRHDDKVTAAPALEHDDLHGAGQLEDVVLFDATPIGRSPRSNPVTFVKAFAPVRQLFAEQRDARARGFTASHFSFNVEGGRCDTCRGEGQVQIDMQFMADVYMPCAECRGSRFRREVLEVKYRGRDIAEVLAMTVRQAFTFFRGQDKILTRLKCLLDVGLDYVQLGQAATTLSVGEAQRLKLATYVGSKRGGRTMFLLDEPTTGLHPADVVKLMDCFDALVDVGHSLVIVEHNLQLMMAADWIIDLGPGPATDGGRVVVTGTPEDVAACSESTTGKYLASALAKRAAQADE